MIIAFYRRPGKVVVAGGWKEILDKIGQVKNVLCLGDFNAHSRIWNCERTDRNGELLQEEIEERDLYIVNRDTLTRVGERGKKHSVE